MKRAAAATDQTSKAGQAAASAAKQAKHDLDAAQRAADQMAASHEQALQTVGSGMAAAGAAALALAGAVAKTGIEYNTLQQTSRAALRTLLGGAEAANAQMDKLDAFAKTSPFSKATFIKAQQQMLAFGIETKKVIPYLDAVSEAVAAAGGSNQQIAEVATIMSKISSSAKITAEDLNQFGNQGIDAARLIGAQMGFTAQEIRAQITAGTLDAGEALDALAAGMKETFDGASANVKDTMTGALDRVKAAWRDLAASMMEPLVGQNGGGFLVDATNRLADFMRMIEGLPGPIKVSLGAITGLAGVVGVAGGAFILALPQIQATVTAFKTLQTTAPALAGAIRGVTAALGVIGAALAVAGFAYNAVTASAREATARTEEYTQAILAQGDAIGETTRRMAAEKLFDAGVLDLAEQYGVALSDVTDAALGLPGAMERVREQVLASNAAIEEKIALNEREMEAMDAANGLTEEQAIRYSDLLNANEALNAELSNRVSGAEEITHAIAEESAMVQEATEEARKKAEAEAESSDATQQSAEAAAEAAKAAEEQAQAVTDAANALLDYYSAVIGAENSQIALADAVDKATEAAAKNGKTLDITTEAGRANRSALLGVAESAIRVANDMAKAGASTSDIEARTQSARDQFIKAAQAMGMSADEANAYADDLGLIPKQVSTLVTTPGVNDSKKNIQGLIDVIGRVPASTTANVKVNVDPGGIYALNNTLNSINGRTYTAAAAVKVYGQGAVATGGYGGDVAEAIGLAGGGMPPHTRRPAGLLEGPGTPTSDSIPAWLSRKEFVTQASAVAYYGTDLMYAINRRAIPREAFAPYGFAGGGSPAVVTRETFAPQQATPQSGANVVFNITESANPHVTSRLIGSELEALL